ncbi:MAG: stage 0 sporulation family protein [Clostridiales Family XIII bacterium]|jgi:cell fate regulator YaaT (PSP1 superfamily)|nr:stage 0 sporulation family protein [Clostridiales Family XIII bacterium]
MIKVAGVGLKSAAKVQYFNSGELEIESGDPVIVETNDGLEYGVVRGEAKEVPDNEYGRSIHKILRVATDGDTERYKEGLEKREEAMASCREKINQRGLDMKLIDADFAFDGSKLIFYFTAEERVDFRELVKDLAGSFHKRIELRQVGVRDEAKMLGGIGCCGRPLCCSGWMQHFEPVSIKMAKVQNLSLNPIKISGSCGRLMCCLKYENDIYQEMRKGMPNTGEVIDTPDGRARVIEANILMSSVKARLIEGARTNDSPEKLSSDIYSYDKDEIKRTKKPNQSGKKGKGGKQGKKQPSNADIADIDKGIKEAISEKIIDVITK